MAELQSVTPDPVTYENFTPAKISALRLGIKLSEIRAAIPELEAACNRKIDASENFANLCKLVALKSGIDASVLSTYINAVCNETLAKKENQANQLTLLFEEMA